jgi:hypothetical protein
MCDDVRDRGAMNASSLMVTVLVLLMAKTLAGIYLGAEYACPSCGARSEDEHAEDCSWSR